MSLVDPLLVPASLRDPNSDPTAPEPFRALDGWRRGNDTAGAAHAFLHAATCPTLRRWSKEIGFEVLQIGVSDDPLRSVARLAAHGSASYFAEPYDEDGGACAWEIVPFASCLHGMPMPAGCAAWAGTIRAELPPGATLEDLAERMALFLAPLDALTCAQAPSVLEARFATGKFLPVMPRYTGASGTVRLVRDLYRVHDAEDNAYLVDALEAALRTLGAGRAAFDEALATLAGAPRSGELMRASGRAPA